MSMVKDSGTAETDYTEKTAAACEGITDIPATTTAPKISRIPARNFFITVLLSNGPFITANMLGMV